MLNKVKVTPGPHVKSPEGTTAIMADVIIALVPALVMAVINFGFRALAITLVCILSCVVFEGLSNLITKRHNTLGDLSAVVTGIILAFNLPVAVPMWLCVVGSFFAIVIVKVLFGGLGNNFMNPAMATRVFLLISFGGLMTTWIVPGSTLPVFSDVLSLDGITSSTPLASLGAGRLPGQSITDMFLGSIGGSLGETSALALLTGGVYLLMRKVITLHIPVAFIGTVFALNYFTSPVDDALTFATYQILAGGLMLGAIFMATDYSSSPIKKGAQILFGIGCGALTVLMRNFGSFPESVSYAIIIMNTLVPLLDKITYRKRYGQVKEKKEVLKDGK